MRTFPNRPRLEVLDAGWFRLMEDWAYEWYHKPSDTDYRLIVQEGFECDLASVPKILHSFIGRKDLGLGPPLLHDMIYACTGNVFGFGYGELEKRVDGRWTVLSDYVSRKTADRMFGRMMREVQVPRWKRRSAYLAVRAFGLPAWFSGRL